MDRRRNAFKEKHVGWSRHWQLGAHDDAYYFIQQLILRWAVKKAEGWLAIL
jgi:hypothetical protein